MPHRAALDKWAVDHLDLGKVGYNDPGNGAPAQQPSTQPPVVPQGPITGPAPTVAPAPPAAGKKK